MIKGHADFIRSLDRFTEVTELIQEFEYVTDINSVSETIEKVKRLGLVVSPLNANIGDFENYNQNVGYGFTFVDVVNNNREEVLNSEDELLFLFRSLLDYYNYTHDVTLTISAIDLVNEDIGGKTTTSASATITVNTKSSASTWKKLIDNA
jgi:hypothetical protein